MVKGISKRVVVVRPEDQAVFEQAIFIVREGEKQDVLREACAVAEQYLRRSDVRVRRWRRRFTVTHLGLSAAAGGAAASLVWAAALFLF